jgi:hypothetical protein
MIGSTDAALLSPAHRRRLGLVAVLLLGSMLGGCYDLTCPAEFDPPPTRRMFCGPGTLGSGGNYVVRPQTPPGTQSDQGGGGADQTY